MSCWPYSDEPGAGLLDECDLESACTAKKVIVLQRASVEGMDDMADVACSACNGRCGAPQACQQADKSAHHARQRWVIATVLMTIGALIAAACIAGYVRVLRWQLACLQDEQRLYIDTGHAGPIFERNSRQQQLEVMARIRQLENLS